jgi:hypothetical protein
MLFLDHSLGPNMMQFEQLRHKNKILLNGEETKKKFEKSKAEIFKKINKFTS